MLVLWPVRFLAASPALSASPLVLHAHRIQGVADALVLVLAPMPAALRAVAAVPALFGAVQLVCALSPRVRRLLGWSSDPNCLEMQQEHHCPALLVLLPLHVGEASEWY